MPPIQAAGRMGPLKMVPDFGNAHTSGFNVVMCDGSVVDAINYSIDLRTFGRLGIRNDGVERREYVPI